MRNIISIDVEQWFHRFTLQRYIRSADFSCESISLHALEATRKILQVFSKYGKRTTFFVLGEIAERLPELVCEITEKGHEVALHGYSHENLGRIGPARFQEELDKGKNLLQRITKQKVKGYRAPNFSLCDDTRWALKILWKRGFLYDSSIFPAITPQYGVPATTWRPYFPSFSDLSKEDPSQKLMELPLLIRKLGPVRIPAAGGFYLRLFGPRFVLDSIRIMNKKGYPAMCYIHPWEVHGFPSIRLPWHKKPYAYFRIPCFQRFETLVRKTDVAPAIDILETLAR